MLEEPLWAETGEEKAKAQRALTHGNVRKYPKDGSAFDLLI